MMIARWFVRGTARARPGVVLTLVLLVGAIGAGAAQATAGVQDYSYAGATQPTAPSGEKPQSKLWFNDGSWWGWMWSTSMGAFDIQRFDEATASWIDSGVAVETRPKALGDALWDGTHLYALSAIRQGGSASDASVRLYRLSYHSTTQTYSLDGGFPVTIFTPASSNDLEAAILDKDSQGTLWATFTYANNPGHCATMDSCPAGRSVLATHSLGSDLAWLATPFVLPVPHASNVSGDDISTIVHFQDKVGVLFSDQSSDQLGNTADYFAWHANGAPDTDWTEETPMIGPLMADDHLNLKAAPDGRVYAAVKTSRNDALVMDPTDPMVLLLERTTDGVWHQAVFDTVASEDTRSQIVIDPAQNLVYQFATYPPTGDYTQGGWIYCKAASMDAPSFPDGRGTSVIQLNGITDHLNNFSSTKQTVGPDTGLLGIATDDETKRYAHTRFALTDTPSCAANPLPPTDPPVTPPVTPPMSPAPVSSTPAAPVATSEIVATTSTTPGAACKVSSASVRLRSLSSLLSVVRRSAVVRLRVSTTCAIRLSMAAQLASAHGTIVASAAVKLTAGQTRVVFVHLTPAGRKLLAHRLHARLVVITRTPAVKGTTAARSWSTAITFTA